MRLLFPGVPNENFSIQIKKMSKKIGAVYPFFNSNFVHNNNLRWSNAVPSEELSLELAVVFQIVYNFYQFLTENKLTGELILSS